MPHSIQRFPSFAVAVLVLLAAPAAGQGQLQPPCGPFTAQQYLASLCCCDLPWVDVREHGAVGDGSADDTQAIRAAVQEAGTLDRARILFPPAFGYLTTATITVPVGIELRMMAPLLFAGDDSSAALVIGEVDAANVDVAHVLRVAKQATSSWQDERSVGIVLHNANASRIAVHQASGFTVGLQCVGSGAGFAYNQIHLGSILNNKVGVELTNFDPGTGIGWCNENVFFDGRFSAWSDVHPGVSRYGVRITSADGTYTGNNNNLFVKPSFELNAQVASPGEALPVLIEHGRLNRFESCRDESNSETFARVLNDSTANEFDTGYGVPLVEDASRYPASRATDRARRLATEPGTVVFRSGPLALRAGPYDATRIHVPGVHLAASGSAGVSTAIDLVSIESDHLRIPGSRAVGVFVDTSRKKRFVVRRAAVLDDRGTADPTDDVDHGGRLRIRCYDAQGAVLQDAGTPLVRGLSSATPYWSASFGGTYTQGADSSADRYFHVDDAVESVAVLLGGGTHDLLLESFSVSSVDAGDALAWPGYEEGIPGSNRALTAPTTGAWEQGRIVFNDDPDPGEDLGWVCTQGGSPGTWTSIGTIGG